MSATLRRSIFCPGFFSGGSAGEELGDNGDTAPNRICAELTRSRAGVGLQASRADPPLLPSRRRGSRGSTKRVRAARRSRRIRVPTHHSDIVVSATTDGTWRTPLCAVRATPRRKKRRLAMSGIALEQSTSLVLRDSGCSPEWVQVDIGLSINTAALADAKWFFSPFSGEVGRG